MPFLLGSFYGPERTARPSPEMLDPCPSCRVLPLVPGRAQGRSENRRKTVSEGTFYAAKTLNAGHAPCPLNERVDSILATVKINTNHFI